MARLQKTLVLLLGDDVQPLKAHLEETINHRKLEDGEPFPQQLLGILALPNDELADDNSKWSTNLERLLNRVNDALTILRLSRERGLNVAQPLSLYIVVSSCDEVGRARLLEVLKLLHRVCRANRFLFQLDLFLLFPGLFEDREDADPQLYRARTFATLYQLHHAMKHRSEPPWEDNPPLNTVWIVDSRNARSEFIGYLGEVFGMIAEMITAFAAGDLEGVYQSSSVVHDDRFFKAFGYCQVHLPLAILKQQMTDRFVAHVLDRQVLRCGRIDSNEVLLAVKQCCHNDCLTAGGILKRIETNPDGSSYLTPLVSEVDTMLPPAAYVEAVDQEAKSYEDGPILQGKLVLHRRASEVLDEIMALLDKTLCELVDTHSSGVFYTQGFLEELIGQGASSELTQGPRLDAPTNLLTRQSELLDQLFEHLGISKYRESLREIERSISNIKTDLKIVEAQLQETEAAADEKKRRASHPETLRQRMSALEDDLESLQVRKTEIEELLGLVNRAVEDLESRNALRQRVEQDWRSRIKATAESLRNAGQELLLARQTLANLGEERPDLQRRYFLHYPIALGAGIIVALLALIFSGRVPFPGVFFNSLTWQAAFLLVGGYFVWALWRFYQRILLQIRQTQKHIAELERQIEKLKLELRENYRQLYHNLFIQHRDNVALTSIQTLIERLNDKLGHVRTFKQQLQIWRDKAAQQPPHPHESLTYVSLLKPEHYEMLFQLLVGEDLDRETTRCLDPNFNGQRASALIWEGSKGADALIQGLQSFGRKLTQRKLEGLGLEEMLWGEPFAELRNRTKLVPEGILRLLTSIAPSVQLHDHEGTMHHAIGVPDAQRSWVRDLLDPSYLISSHRDPSRLTAFCVTNGFLLEALSQLDYFREAFQAVWPRRKDELGLDKVQVEQILAEYTGEPIATDKGSSAASKRDKERSK